MGMTALLARCLGARWPSTAWRK